MKRDYCEVENNDNELIMNNHIKSLKIVMITFDGCPWCKKALDSMSEGMKSEIDIIPAFYSRVTHKKFIGYSRPINDIIVELS